MISSSLSIIVALVGTVALALALFLIVKTERIARRLERLTANMGGEDIEATLFDHYDRLKQFEEAFETLVTEHTQTAEVARESIRNVSMVRFNPFPGEIGGDQSFSVALLDGNHDGAVITALHSREGTRIYAKPIVKGLSDYNLSHEEKRAIKEAISRT